MSTEPFALERRGTRFVDRFLTGASVTALVMLTVIAIILTERSWELKHPTEFIVYEIVAATLIVGSFVAWIYFRASHKRSSR